MASRIIDGLIFASVIVLAVGSAYGLHLLPWRVLIFVFAPVLQFIFYKKTLHHGMTATYCTGMTWIGAAMFVVYHLWVLAGLPGSGV